MFSPGSSSRSSDRQCVLIIVNFSTRSHEFSAKRIERIDFRSVTFQEKRIYLEHIMMMLYHHRYAAPEGKKPENRSPRRFEMPKGKSTRHRMSYPMLHVGQTACMHNGKRKWDVFPWDAAVALLLRMFTGNVLHVVCRLTAMWLLGGKCNTTMDVQLFNWPVK